MTANPVKFKHSCSYVMDKAPVAFTLQKGKREQGPNESVEVSVTQAADRIRESICRSPGCSLDDLIQACPTLGWNEIFFELDRMSRSGEILLIDCGHGRYSVQLVEPPNNWFDSLESVSHSPIS